MIIKKIYKKSKRLGISLLENGKEFNSKRYKYGSKFSLQRKKREKEYGTQIIEKNKFRLLYGIKEKQLKEMFKKAKKRSNILTKEISEIAESRLDNLIFRSGIAETRKQARQMVAHGFFIIEKKDEKNNEKKKRATKSPSYEVKFGEEIKVKKNYNEMKKINSKLSSNFKTENENSTTTNIINNNGYLTIELLKKDDKEAKEAESLKIKKNEIKMREIVEFYKKKRIK